ncbi:MAG: TIGR03118 family protein [Kofleriaceae bacterium]|nr:TIGR03118 family protein [Kofleriaceae bacterium]
MAVSCVGGCGDDNDLDDVVPPPGTGGGGGGGGGSATLTGFAVDNLVSDNAELAKRVDPDLVNSWGITPGLGWLVIADNGTGKVSIYDGDGNPKTTPPASGQIDLGEGITGVVADPENKFMIGSGANCPPAELIFVNEDGQVIAFNQAQNPTGGTVVVNNPGANYKGVTIAGNNLLVANFVGKEINVYDTNFAKVDLGAGAFTDPNLPADFGPFNVMTIGTDVFVTYAQVDPATGDEVKGKGLGVVDAYDFNGKLLRRVADDGDLNAPWGMALAPATFGDHAGQLLVGNFGDGLINTFDPATGEPLGLLADPQGTPLAVDGLWGMTFGTGGTGGNPDVLYFAAGPNDEANGLFGRIRPVSVTVTTP